MATPVRRKSDWKELFQGIYLKRTLSIWAMWFCAYMVANGTITWLPTLYRQTFNLPLENQHPLWLYDLCCWRRRSCHMRPADR